MAKVDRRVRRTRRKLRQALIDLIIEQGYDNITIQKITDRADLSRATFYLHYKGGKDELLAHSLESMFDELIEAQQPTEGDPHGWLYAEPVPSLLAFEHVAEYSTLYKALLLGERGVASVMHHVLMYLARLMLRDIECLMSHSERPQPRLPLPIIAHAAAGSLYSVILWWLENDLPHTPTRMANAFHQLMLPGIIWGLGGTPDFAQLGALLQNAAEAD